MMSAYLQRIFGKNAWWPVVVLIVLTVLVYGPSLGNSFVWDDLWVIVDNNFVKSWSNFPLLFSREYLTSASQLQQLGQHPIGAGEASYRPVVTVSYFIDYFFWKLNPFGYHLTSLLIHVANALLLYALVKLLIGNGWWSLTAALIFALHPIQTEAVCNASFREDLLAFLFSVSSFILFIKLKDFEGKRKTLAYVMSNALLFLALFSKEMAITLPLILIIYDYFFAFDASGGACSLSSAIRVRMRYFWARFKSCYLGYSVVSLFYLWVWMFAIPSVNERLVFAGQNAYTNFLTMAKVCALYVRLLVMPIDIHAFIPDASVAEYSLWRLRAVLSIGVVLACLLYAVKVRHRFKLISFSIFWFFVTLLPVLNIIPIQNVIACRYLYIPTAGFSLCAACFLQRLSLVKTNLVSEGFLLKAVRMGLTGLLIIYGLTTVERSLVWKSGDTFFADLVRYYPKKTWIHKGLAKSFSSQGRLDEAIVEYRIAQSLDAGDVENYKNLSTAYLAKGMLDEAIVELENVVRLAPQAKEEYSQLCSALGVKEEYEESVRCFKGLIKIHPQYTQAYYNLGMTYLRMGNPRGTRAMLEQVLAVDPHYAPAREHLEILAK